MSERLTQLTKMHQADPQDPFCTYAIAMEHIKTGQTQEAIAWLDKTLGLDGKYCYAYYQKARLLAKSGDVAGAKAVLGEGMRVAATADPHAQAEMRTLLESMG